MTEKDKPNPFTQPCRTCQHIAPKPLKVGVYYCRSLDDYVEGWWTGCIRWERKAKNQESK